MKLTEDIAYQIIDEQFKELAKNDEFYDVDMFVTSVIDELALRSNAADDSKLEFDWQSGVFLGIAMMSWLRSAEGVNAFSDQGAFEIILELNFWAENNLPNDPED